MLLTEIYQSQYDYHKQILQPAFSQCGVPPTEWKYLCNSMGRLGFLFDVEIKNFSFDLFTSSLRDILFAPENHSKLKVVFWGVAYESVGNNSDGFFENYPTNPGDISYAIYIDKPNEISDRYYFRIEFLATGDIGLPEHIMTYIAYMNYKLKININSYYQKLKNASLPVEFITNIPSYLPFSLRDHRKIGRMIQQFENKKLSKEEIFNILKSPVRVTLDFPTNEQFDIVQDQHNNIHVYTYYYLEYLSTLNNIFCQGRPIVNEFCTSDSTKGFFSFQNSVNWEYYSTEHIQDTVFTYSDSIEDETLANLCRCSLLYADSKYEQLLSYINHIVKKTGLTINQIKLYITDAILTGSMKHINIINASNKRYPQFHLSLDYLLANLDSLREAQFIK